MSICSVCKDEIKEERYDEDGFAECSVCDEENNIVRPDDYLWVCGECSDIKCEIEDLESKLEMSVCMYCDAKVIQYKLRLLYRITDREQKTLAPACPKCYNEASEDRRF